MVGATIEVVSPPSTGAILPCQRLGRVGGLSYAKIVLLAKNIFAILNIKDKQWIHNFNLKYGNFNIWASFNPAKTSWFYEILSKTTEKLRSNLCINVCNFGLYDILIDPWTFDISMALKSPYVNVDLPIESLHISNFFHDHSLKGEELTIFLGNECSLSKL